MADYGFYKNAEGYADPTAAEAIKGMTIPGEIYQYKGKEVLIVKNQGGYSNILTLAPAPGKDKHVIEVAGRYTTPEKLNYAFNSNLGAMVERITDGELKEVYDEIETAFKFFKIYEESEHATESGPDEEYELMVRDDRIRFLESANKRLEKQFELMRDMYDELLNKFIDRFGDCG